MTNLEALDMLAHGRMNDDDDPDAAYQQLRRALEAAASKGMCQRVDAQAKTSGLEFADTPHAARIAAAAAVKEEG